MKIIGNIIEQKQVSQPSSDRLPLLNYLYTEAQGEPFYTEYYQISRKKRLMWLVTRTPEAMSVIESHARDICGQFKFEPIEDGISGRNLLLRSNRFATKNRFKKLLFNIIIDMLVTGEGYMYKKELTRAQISMINEEMRKLINSAKYDEDYYRLRDLRQVASTTMGVNFDDYDVIGYTQKIYGNEDTGRKFDLNEIIRLTFYELNGKVEGYTPLYTIPIQFELLWLLWSNQYNLQLKGNHPDLVVVANALQSNHPSFKQLEKKLQQYNTPGNSNHGTMAFAGGASAGQQNGALTIHQLEKADTLQFKQVGDYIQTLIASLFQFPLSRLGIKTEQATKTKDSNNNADKGYWAGVEQKQDMIAMVLNSQLWEPYFGVRMVFDKSYKQDAIRETQATQGRVSNVTLLNNLLQTRGLQVSTHQILSTYNNENRRLSESDLEPARTLSPTSTTLNDQLSDSSEQSSESDEKRQAELTREETVGKPLGS